MWPRPVRLLEDLRWKDKFLDHIGIMEKKTETSIVYWGYIGFMEKKMETEYVRGACVQRYTPFADICKAQWPLTQQAKQSLVRQLSRFRVLLWKWEGSGAYDGTAES